MRDYQDGIQEGSLVRRSEKEKLPAPTNKQYLGRDEATASLHKSSSTAAVKLKQLNRLGSELAKNSVLNLQKQHGNRYVQRVVSLYMQAEGETDVAPPDVQQAIESSRGGGQPLDSAVRVQMGKAFNADFGGVRVYADSQADSLNRSLNARAFTTGKDVFFRQGEYNPSSSTGKQLLAHELTHVVQQNPDIVQRSDEENASMSGSACGGGTGKLGRTIQAKLALGRPGDIYEQEADRMARAFPAWEQRMGQTQDSTASVRRLKPEEEKKEEEATVRTKPQDGLALRQIEEEDEKDEGKEVMRHVRREGIALDRKEASSGEANGGAPWSVTLIPHTADDVNETVSRSSILAVPEVQGRRMKLNKLTTLNSYRIALDAEQQAPPTTIPAPGSAPPSQQVAPSEFDTNWFVDYSVIPMTGVAQKVKTRDDQSALYIDELSVFPSTATKSLPKLSGVNAKSTGKILLGALAHPADSGGKVSGKVRFGSKPGFDLTVEFSDDTDPKSKLKFARKRTATEKTLKKELSQKLSELTEQTADLLSIEAELQSLAESQLPEGDDKHSYSVKVSVKPKVPAGMAGQPFVLSSANYPKVDRLSNFDVNVSVPVKERETAWSTSESGKGSTSTTSTAQVTAGTGEKLSITESEKQTITKSVKDTASVAVKDAWSKQKQNVESTSKLSETSSTKTLSGESTQKLAFDVSAKDFSLPIPGSGILKKILKYIVKIDAKGTGDLTAKESGSTSWTDRGQEQTSTSITTTELNSVESQITSALETYVSTQVEKSASTSIEKTFNVSVSAGAAQTVGGEKSRTVTSSSKSVTYATGQPQLDVQKVE